MFLRFANRLAGICLLVVCLVAPSPVLGESSARPKRPPVVRPRVLESLPHDPEAFTQGLLIDGEFWLESTGRYGRSELREVERRSGEVRRRVPLEDRFFGEGLALCNGLLYQLTWREGVCLVYDRESLLEVERFSYRGEGWGLASDGRRLYMSDGSAVIRVIDPTGFRETRRFEVRGPGGAVGQLNEIAWIDGELWANVFSTKLIVRFSPVDGRVMGFLDLGHLPPPGDEHLKQDVLNGIAVDPGNGAIWVTGKNWKRLYRLAWPPAEREE